MPSMSEVQTAIPLWLPGYGRDWLLRVLAGPSPVLGKEMGAPCRDLVDSYIGMLLDLADLIVPHHGPELGLEDRLNLRGGLRELRRYSDVGHPRQARLRPFCSPALDLRGIETRPSLWAYVGRPGE